MKAFKLLIFFFQGSLKTNVANFFLTFFISSSTLGDQ